MVNGITFSEQLTTSADFAHFQNTFLNRANGVTKGCGISQADGSVYVQKGYFVVCGRFVRVVGVETIGIPEVLSGSLYCKVVFEVDLTKTNSPEEFRQGRFKVLSSIDAYPIPRQEDLDADGTLYQMPWCQFVKDVGGITEFRDLRPIMNMESIWAAVSAQNNTYKSEFDTYFTAQKLIVEQMIAELEMQGYVRLDVARRITYATLSKEGWSGTAPYIQTVEVPGVLAIDTPVIKEHIPGGTGAEAEKAIRKAADMISYIDTADGRITATCIGSRPLTDFQIMIKAV